MGRLNAVAVLDSTRVSLLSAFGKPGLLTLTTTVVSSTVHNKVITLKSLISMEFFLFFLRKYSQLHALFYYF